MESVLGATPREFESRILRHARRPPEVAISRSELGAANPTSHARDGRLTAPSSAKAGTWGALGGGCLAVAAAALGVTALLGPSAAEAPLGQHDDGATPPLHLSAHPPAWLVTTLLAVAVVAGTIAVVTVLTHRWRPPARRLCLAGLAVAAGLALLPPVASADPLSYASYGHMVTTGHDPWTTTPHQLAGHDPVAAAVEPPWQDEPAVYGPLAAGEQAVASSIAGDDVALTVWLLDILGTATFILVGWLLVRGARDEPTRLRRAALWAANPLLWLQLVAGAHLDVAVAALALGAVTVGRRRPAAGSALAGAAALVKPPGGLAWAGLAWTARRDPRRLAVLVAAAAVVVVPAYAIAGRGVVRELSRASRRVSHGTPWRPIVTWTHLDRSVVGALALLLALALVTLLLRRADRDDPATVAAAAALAYVLAAPYALPWYDALPWALLLVIAASWWDWLLLAHTTVLSLAYLPGRDAVPLHGALASLTHAMRNDVAPVVLALLLVAVAASGLNAQRSSAASARSQPSL